MISNKLIGCLALVLAPTLAAAHASAQTGAPYNRAISPGLTYGPSTSGEGFQVSGEVQLDVDTDQTYDLSYAVSVLVNGAAVGDPWVVGALVSNRPNCTAFCTSCTGICFQLRNYCFCLVIRGGPASTAFALHVPELVPGDIVTVRVDALPDSLAEIDTSDDQQTLVIGPPPCPADFNQSGAVNSQDFFDFLAAFFASAPSADFNHSGAIDSQDFFDFLAAFFSGCP